MSGGEPRHLGRRLLALTPDLVVLLVLALAFGSFQYDVPRRLGWTEPSADPALVEPPTGLELPEVAAPDPVAGSAPEGDVRSGQVRRALAPYLRDRDLGRHVVAMVATADGEPVFASGTGAATPASTTKLVTAAAAIEALGPDHRFTTSVVPGTRRGEIVLVGGGDPYLTRRAGKGDYPEYADLRTLARETADALGTTRRVRLAFDDSLFSGPAFSPDWPPTYGPEGVVAPIESLLVDQGARRTGFGFEPDPAQAAAEVFAEELGKAGVTVTRRPVRTTADPAAAPLAAVESPPVWQVAERMLLVSDNEGAELLARHVAIEEGFAPTFAGAIDGLRLSLDRLGVQLRQGDRIFDGSGLSREDRLTPQTLIDVLALAASDDHPELRTLVAGLPVAGFTGSLTSRFVDGPDAGPGRVRAKTGTLTGVHGLAGVTTTADGTVLLFVLLADKVRVEDTLEARKTIDDMAAALAGIGA